MHRRDLLTSVTAFALVGLAPSLAKAQARDLRGKSVSADDVDRALYINLDAPQDAGMAPPAAGSAEAGAVAAIIVDITFDLNSATIRPEGARALDAVAEASNRPQNVGRRIGLEGHTDTSGPFDYNMQLSRGRAESVRAYLVARGVAPARLAASGYGPTRLLPGFRQTDPRHRRVEIVNLG